MLAQLQETLLKVSGFLHVRLNIIPMKTHTHTHTSPKTGPRIGPEDDSAPNKNAEPSCDRQVLQRRGFLQYGDFPPSGHPPQQVGPLSEVQREINSGAL